MQDFGREIYSHFPSEILHNLQYFPIFALFCGHISGVWQNNKGGGEKSGDGRAETEQVGAEEQRRKNGDGTSGGGRAETEEWRWKEWRRKSGEGRVEKEQEVRKREEERKYWE